MGGAGRGVAEPPRHLPPIELIELAENTKALDVYELEALEEAWLAMFGETLELFCACGTGIGGGQRRARGK